jgi:hypothetical protein
VVRNPNRLSTGAPLPPPAWQMLCTFANGTCLCAAKGTAPCPTVERETERIRGRIWHDLAAEYHMRRKEKG